MNNELKEARGRYTQSRISLEVVLAAAGNADRRIGQCRIVTREAQLGSILFTKALLHTRSLAAISPPIGGAGVYDLSSAAVLVRAVAETYTAMRYTCMESQSAEETEFRFALLEYHHRATTCRQLKKAALTGGVLDKADAASDNARQVLERSAVFQAQEARVRKLQIDGQVHMHRSQSDIAREGGIDPAFWIPTYIFLSQFAHSSPLGVRQFAGATGNRPVAATNMSLFVIVGAGLLAKMALDLANLVPDVDTKLTVAERKCFADQSANLSALRYGDLAWPQ